MSFFELELISSILLSFFVLRFLLPCLFVKLTLTTLSRGIKVDERKLLKEINKLVSLVWGKGKGVEERKVSGKRVARPTISGACSSKLSSEIGWSHFASPGKEKWVQVKNLFYQTNKPQVTQEISIFFFPTIKVTYCCTIKILLVITNPFEKSGCCCILTIRRWKGTHKELVNF